MNNQTAFLNTLRAACNSSGQENRYASFAELLKARENAPTLSITDMQAAKALPQADLLELLSGNAAQLNLNLHTPGHRQDAAELILELALNAPLEFTSRKQIVCHPSPAVQEMGLAQLLTDHDITFVLTDTDTVNLREQTIQSYIGITFPSFVVADSATIVQICRPGFPRSTSLVPSIHIAVATYDQLVPSLDWVYDSLKTEALPNALTFISGPSKTADIEAQMVHGAHGPREMHLILVK